ncbi:MAG: CNNM domain-containing protein [Haloarculaceae archaeon]
METAVFAGRLCGGLALLLANAYFVTTEFAMTRVRQFPREEFVDAGRGPARAWEMTERLEVYLSGCQVGITVASVGLGVVAEPAIAAAVGPLLAVAGLGGTTGHAALSVVLALAVINLLHIVVGEQAPTYLGVERTRQVAGYCAEPLYWWTKLMAPVILAADRVAKWLLGLGGVAIDRSWTEEESGAATRAELRSKMGETLRGADLSVERRHEVMNALDIGEMPVESVMIDREEVVPLRTAESLSENLAVMNEYPHVRFPLVETDLDSFVGIVYTPAVLRDLEALEAGEHSLSDLAAPPVTVAPDTTVSGLIDRLQAEGQELALVCDEEEVIGLVTATDAFEAIAGELHDPLDKGHALDSKTVPPEDATR